MRVLPALVAILALGALLPPPTAHAQAALLSTPAAAGTPDIELLGPVSPLPAKQRTNVFLAVENLGPGAIHDVSVLVQPSSGGLVVVGQIERSLQDLAGNASAAMVVRVATPDVAGSATLSLTFSFTTDAGVRTSVTRSVNLQIAPPETAPLDVTTTDAPLVAGKEGNLSLRVSNPTGQRLTNLDLTLLPARTVPILSAASGGAKVQDLTPGNGSALLLHGAQLGPGESVSVQAPVTASLRPQDLVPFSVQASYTVNGFARDQTFDFGVRVVGDVQIRVLDAHLTRTDQGLVLVGTVVNSGTGTAWSPRVDAAEGSGLQAERPQIVADLKPNEATDFQLPVKQVGALGGPLLKIDWNDDFGTIRATQVAAQPVTPPPEAPGFFSRAWSALRGPWGLLALVALALLVGVEIVRRVGRAHREREEALADEAEESGAAPQDPRSRRRGGKKPRPH